MTQRFYDGAKVKEAEQALMCLEADLQCEHVERLVVTKMFEDASSKLLNSDDVYKAAGDAQRSFKVVKLLELIALLDAYEKLFAAKDYGGAVTKLTEAVASLEGVVDMAPVTLLVPQALLRNGQCGPHSPPQIVRCRALQVGMADTDEAAAALALEAESPGTEAGPLYYDKCRAALAEARVSFAWANAQIAETADVAQYKVVGIAPPEVRKMEEIERRGAKAQEDVTTLAARCERDHAEARGDDGLQMAKDLLANGIVTIVEAEANAASPDAMAKGAPTTPTDLDGEENGVYAVLQRAEDEFDAADVPEKAAEVQRIRKRCMGVVFMAEAKAFYQQKNFEECLERATEAKFCFRDAEDEVKTAEVS